ncbi:MAG: 16S rRNA (guanine(527)-N(7))-methyltransferase RsmG [Ruminococcus sp.]|uniref:16S rRNA (guanine(527)-N(7))-methyltransferase RsmG n=1 Tax=Ruminococcus sp. TaxID=41978 RepID=UPI0025CBFD6F|nr:16S rRNA (guanine(527)-N(7))-methyltransferase RsmG [Ruminococcus sp.]MBR5683868.1 16S rRNA (guanine(527)-N(7))-methyltransferase RsmG [Ruminococcus sp.]
MLPEFDLCCSEFQSVGLELSQELYERLDIYADFLVEYNEKVNLTAIIDGSEILKKHFIDSIILSKYVEIPENSTFIDVGTGAGFPSVPLKLFCPDIKITLLDSLNKRVEFLRQLCDRLGIEADFIHGRAEDFSKLPEYREQFDFSCARAVANLSLLSEFCIPFVKVGGSFISMKGPSEDLSEGENAVKLLGGKIGSIAEYELFGEQRRIVDVKKISQTPPKYPRNSGQIKKKQL